MRALLESTRYYLPMNSERVNNQGKSLGLCPVAQPLY